MTDADGELEAWVQAAEARFRGIDNQLDDVRLELSTKIDRARRDLAVIVLRATLGIVVATAALCLGTIVLLL